jgi:hypothetical protein
VVFIALSVVAVATCFSYTSLLFDIVFYELLKIICCIKYGIRESGFLPNVLFSLLTNMAVFGLLAFLYLIEHII